MLKKKTVGFEKVLEPENFEDHHNTLCDVLNLCTQLMRSLLVRSAFIHSSHEGHQSPSAEHPEEIDIMIN